MYTCDTANSMYSTVIVTAQDIATDLESNKLYAFVSTVACWIAQGETPTASAAAGSKFCGPNEVVLLDGGHGATVSVIRNAGDGAASLTPVTVVR